MVNLPNTITTVRIILVPLFLYELWHRNITASIILLSVIMMGDVLDGYVARKFKQVTKLGTVLDTVADRIVMVPTFIILVLRYNVPVALGLLVLTRDFIFLIGLFMLMFVKERKKHITGPIWLGKITTVLLTATAIAIAIDFYQYAFMTATIIVSITTATLYVIRAVKHHKQIKQQA
jgi:CDP-diacylglycerol--glycerol-3-phosphate 3-phosphatidyltransferase